jgi:sulfite exporter TauE/SafE
MLGSITPLGERSRGRRWGITVTAFAVGAVGAGAALGALLGAAGSLAPLSRAAALAALAVVLALAVVVDAAPGLHAPGPTRQVNEDWLHRYRGWAYGAGFGVQLGLGVTTIVSTAAVYATGAAAVLTGSAAAGALVGGAFGAARAATLLGSARVRGPRGLAVLDRRLEEWERPARAAAILAQAGLAALALALVA